MVLPEDLLSGCDWRIRVLCNLYTTSKWQSLEHWGHMYTRSPLPPPIFEPRKGLRVVQNCNVTARISVHVRVGA